MTYSYSYSLVIAIVICHKFCLLAACQFCLSIVVVIVSLSNCRYVRERLLTAIAV